MISILLPTYNQGEFIEDTLKDLENQTFKDYEFIIVNDGSTDNTSEIIHRYAKKDNRIKIFEQKNQGTAVALNKAYSMAKHNYITWVTSDNLYEPNFLERLLEEFKKDKTVQFVFSDFLVVDENKKQTGKWIFPYFDQSLWMMLTTGLAGMCFMYTKQTGDLVGEYKKQFIQEDFDYFAKMSELVKTVHIPEVLGSTRVHKNKRGIVFKDRIKKEYITMMNNALIRRKKLNLFDLESLDDEIYFLFKKQQKIKVMLYAKIFDLNLLNKKFLIFGTGILGMIVKDMLDTFNLKNVGFVDSFWKSKDKFLNMDVFKPNEISDVDYDIILIASQGKSKEIYNVLKKLGVLEEKIISV